MKWKQASDPSSDKSFLLFRSAILMKPTFLLSALFAMGVGGLLLSQIQDTEPLVIMPFISNPGAACQGCHHPEGTNTQTDPLARACSDFCLKCHQKVVEGHHTIHSTIDAKLPPVFRLNSKGETACITCHDLSRPRYDSAPWKSTSLFSSMFRRSGRYNTYFLVQKNNAGQLCRHCH
jgi:predicted CXXCH cytochrome family protein